MITIIAELGSSPAPAWEFADWCATAANCGADAVKVQLFKAEHFPQAERAQKRVLAFPRGSLAGFVSTAHFYGLTAGASVFDADAVALAAEHCDWLKLAAREQNNHELRRACNATGKTVYRSLSRLSPDTRQNEISLYAIQQYPAPMLLSLQKVLQAKWHYWNNWGWSSHTRGALDCVLAASLGACVIEKHLALNKTDIEAGHSLLPVKFAAMCSAIRKVERHVTH